MVSSNCMCYKGPQYVIGDYRGKSGKWTEEDRKTTSAACNEESDKEEPSNEEEGVPYEQLRPTYTHEAICKLVEMGHIRHVISQNCDDLHGLSGIPYDALSELHGNVYLESCDVCHKVYNRPYYVLDDAAYQYYSDIAEHSRSELPPPKYGVQCSQCTLTHYTGRACEARDCHGLLKDSIINFGDNLNESVLANAEEVAKRSDLILSLGSTMQVTPACDLVLMGKTPQRLVIINRQKTNFDSICSETDARGDKLGVRVYGDCDRVMKCIMREFMTETNLLEWENGRDERLKTYNSRRNIPT